MSQEIDPSLRKSLDAIDSFRWRLTAAGWFTVALTFGAYAWLSHVARISDSPKRLLMTAVFALTCMIATSTYALAIFVLRITKRILRAIEIAATVSRQRQQ